MKTHRNDIAIYLNHNRRKHAVLHLYASINETPTVPTLATRWHAEN